MFGILREHLGNWLIAAFGIVLLVHFVLFWTSGDVRIFEHNRYVLGVETAMAVLIIVLGVEREVDEYRKKKKEAR